jgi:two-component system, OmpR family, sensor histidine kinase ChvG
MVRDIGSLVVDDSESDSVLSLTGRLSLTKRILLVNIVAVLLLAGSFFYLDGVRDRLVKERVAQAEGEARLVALALSRAPPNSRNALMVELARAGDARLRLFSRSGQLVADSWTLGQPNFALRDPSREAWQRGVARFMDDAIDFVVDAQRPRSFQSYPTPGSFGKDSVLLSLAPDRTHIISAQETLNDRDGLTLISDRNARDIRRLVRAERSRLGQIIGIATLMSVLLSLFLARTIVRPIRKLVRAAILVRVGREREVTVPRLPSRSDEIGMLARALSDMSQALRQRIDASEAFAADVTHEIKNPLASLRSATESLGNVKDPALQKKLLAVMDEDVRRLDRLITDIGELSRLDAQLTRIRFVRVDLGPAIERMIKARDARNQDGDVKIAFARPLKNTAVIHGEESQVLRVIDNLLDNAVSFSPAGGVVRVIVERDRQEVIVAVEDEGPGIPPEAREDIFQRFHSYRPNHDSFGKHSGLGLSIARTIIAGHDGSISATEPMAGRAGARIEIRLRAASGDQV